MPQVAPVLDLPPTGFLRIRHIIGDSKRGIPPVIPVSKSTWFAGIASGRFPKGVLLGPRTRAWKVEVIRALIAEMANSQAAR